MPQVDKQPMRVLTVDKERRRIEGALRDGGTVYAAIWEVPAFFRWPKTGEVWTINLDHGVWRLGNIFESVELVESNVDLANINEGEARILAEPSEAGSGLYIGSVYAARAVSADIGDGVNTIYPVFHNLGTKDVTVSIREPIITNLYVEADIATLDTNSVQITFGVVPSENQYRVTFTG